MPNSLNRGWNYKMKGTMYLLKRQLGGPIDIHILLSSETDPKTGEKVITRQVYHVRRAVILPNRVKRKADHSISQISENKKFVVGGFYDQGVRDFLVDRLDVPTLQNITTDDWVVYNGKKYQIEEAEYNEFDAAWDLKTKELVGEEVPNNEFHIGAVSVMPLADAADGSQS